ncbi:MAG TPA: response regulator transcription factor, partial [bacterium]
SVSAGARGSASAAPGDGIRVLVVDDHAVMREGLSRMLTEEGGIEVVGEADDGQKAIEMAWKLSPDVVLMDVSMASLGGIDATRVIHSSMPEIKIIGLSMLDDAGTAQEMLTAGATVHLSKSGPVSQIVRAVRACTGRADPPPAP